MITGYDFSLQLNGRGKFYTAFPNWKGSATLDYEKESDEQFFRKKFGSELTFMGSDYDFIMAQPFDTVFYVYISASSDRELGGKVIYDGKFSKIDAAIDADNRTLRVKLTNIDDYEEILTGIDKEYNIYDIVPEITTTQIPIIGLVQLYLLGDDKITNYQSGSWWVQDSTAQDKTVEELFGRYGFEITDIPMRVMIDNSSEQAANGMYSGVLRRTMQTAFPLYHAATLVREDGTRNYEIHVSTESRSVYGHNHTLYNMYLYDNSTRRTVASWDSANDDFHTMPTSGRLTSSGTVIAIFKSETDYVFARYLTNKVIDQVTTELPAEDVVVSQYRQVFRLKGFGFAIMSTRFSQSPTKWGLSPDNTYYLPPDGMPDPQPLSPNFWGSYSIWVEYPQMFNQFSEQFLTYQTLRDTYLISDVIRALLAQISPGISHDGTAEYSEFLYGMYNPLPTLPAFRLAITQKSNVLNLQYDEPAHNAPITLRKVLDMLRDVYRCYWWVDDDSRFRIEHISYFLNGHSYQAPGYSVGLDLTQMINRRNGKQLAFGQNSYTFNKEELPERYEFQWMDDVSEYFRGYPINVLSPNVKAGNIQKVSISDFTSDIGMMLSAPETIDRDGFALFSLWSESATGVGLPISGVTDYLPASKLLEPGISLYRQYWGRTVNIRASLLNNNGAADYSVCAVFLDNNNEIIAQSEPVLARVGITETLKWLVEVPENAFTLGFALVYSTVPMLKLTITLEQFEALSVPFIQMPNPQGQSAYIVNPFASFVWILPTLWLYDMPASEVEIAGINMAVRSIRRSRQQTINVPAVDGDPDPTKLIKTGLGLGFVDKISVNLLSRNAKIDLKYENSNE